VGERCELEGCESWGVCVRVLGARGVEVEDEMVVVMLSSMVNSSCGIDGATIAAASLSALSTLVSTSSAPMTQCTYIGGPDTIFLASAPPGLSCPAFPAPSALPFLFSRKACSIVSPSTRTRPAWMRRRLRRCCVVGRWARMACLSARRECVDERDLATLLPTLDLDVVTASMVRRRSEILLSAKRITIGCAAILAM